MTWVVYDRLDGRLIEAAESQHELAKALVERDDYDPNHAIMTLAGHEPVQETRTRWVPV